MSWIVIQLLPAINQLETELVSVEEISIVRYMLGIEVWSCIDIFSFEGNRRQVSHDLTKVRVDVLLGRFGCQLLLVQGLPGMLSLNVKPLSSCKFHLIE